MAERSKEQIEAEIAAARQRLVSNVEGLITQVHPRAVAMRGVADAKGFFRQEATSAKAQFTYSDGSLKTERVVYLVAAVAGTLVFLGVLRSLVRTK